MLKAVAVALMLPLGLLADSVDWTKAESIVPGVRVDGYRTETPRLMECRLLRVDLRQKGLSFVTTGRAAERSEAMPDVTNRTMIVDTRRETTEAFMRRMRKDGHDVVAAVNTTPWSPWKPPRNHRFARLPHLTVANGEVLSHVCKPGPMLVVWKDNTAVITNDLAETDFTRVALAHPGFGIVMRNGKVPPRNEGKPNLAPRTPAEFRRTDAISLFWSSTSGRRTGLMAQT